MPKLRVLFVPNQYTDHEGDTEVIAEFPLSPAGGTDGLLSIGRHRDVILPTGEQISVMCEVTRYGNYFHAYHNDVCICRLRTAGRIELVLRLPTGNEFSAQLLGVEGPARE